MDPACWNSVATVLMAAYQFTAAGKKWTFQVNATNIFNRVYLNEVQLTNSIPSPVEPFGWINGVYGPLRTVIGTMKVEL
jgi:outer membrane receptor protein involved in Fe transport